jgi:LysR family transcriptional regulator, glycine cleavage system transcriptional activator
MSRKTPPFSAMRAFAALVQHGSIAAAAEDLSLTVGAVGHQIRQLEQFLDLQLTERAGKRVLLTAAGREYGYQIRQSLDDMAEATERLVRHNFSQEDDVLRISVLPSFAQGWLLPRIGTFCRMHPRIRFVWHMSMDFVRFDHGQVDCAIRFGHGAWRDAVIQPLMGDCLMLLAAPQLFAGAQPPQSLEEVFAWPLLHASESWSTFCASLPGADKRPVRPASRMAFNDSTQLLQAARCGLGIALSRQSIAAQLLQEQALVQVLPHRSPHPSSYYVLTEQGGAIRPALKAFLTWLQDSCEAYAQQAQAIRPCR